MKELTKTEQVEVMQIALSFLTKPHSSVRVLADLDLSDEYLEGLRVKLDKLLNPKTEVTLNNEQQLYVVPCGDGYTCRGYDSLMLEANTMADILGGKVFGIRPDQRGTIEAYNRHAEIVKLYCASPYAKDTWFDPGTCQPVRDILERYHKNRKLIRLFYGRQDTGTSWLDAHNVIGQVGRSMGPIRIPLLICKSSDAGGGAILTGSIIRLMDVVDGTVLWQHEKFNVPALHISPVTEPEVSEEGLKFEVGTVNERYARFYTERQASDFIKFLCGERMRLPVAKKH